MSLVLPKIYPITDTSLSGLSHLEQVMKFVAGGAVLIQLRDKHSSPHDFYESAAASIEFARPRGVKIIINDRVDIAMALAADGVHLGQDDLPVSDARKLLGERAIIGLSTHSLDQAKATISLPLDYIAIGPIFSTQTKPNADPVVGLELVRMVRNATRDIPIVAIGGLDRNNYQPVLQAGADSVAVISDLLRDPKLIAETYRTMNKC